MEATAFEDILSQPASEIERPRPAPQGSYVCLVKGQPNFDKSAKKQTPFVEFFFQPLQAGEDVDEEELKEVLTQSDGTVGPLENLTFRETYYLSDKAKFRLRNFLERDLGIELGDKSIGQVISEAPGRQVLVFIKHTWSDDGQSVYANVGKTAPVED